MIEEAGRGTFYVFDCLSDLAVDWYSDQMLGNFFMLTCPYLYDLETVTYFGLLRNRHSSHATGAISETTQLLLDVYRHDGTLYVRPLKVQHRYSPTMDMLHVWTEEGFKPVTSSAVVSEVLTSGKMGRGTRFGDQHRLLGEGLHPRGGAARVDPERRMPRRKRQSRCWIGCCAW